MAAPRSTKSAGLSNPLAKKILAVGLAIFCGYLVADVGTLYARKYMLPNQIPPAKPKFAQRSGAGANYYNVVNRNIFSSDGVIPEPLVAEGGSGQQQEAPPVLSQLPLTLMGTLVHSNPEKSLAALDIKGKNTILSFRPKQQIENLATLEKVERMKIFIRNTTTGRLEFLEMKNAPKVSLRQAAAPQKGDVKKVGETDFEIKRADLLKHTSDLSSILMQARAVPARRGGNGEVYGYRIVEMQPNSIYTQLGLQVMDVITGVNGTPVTNPQQAMEMYQTLRNSPQIKIQVERGGRNQEMNYRIAN